MLDWIAEGLEKRAAQGLLRVPTVVAPIDAVRVAIEGRACVSFCGNDYLGLRWDESVRRAASEAALSWGAGSGASRLVSGNVEVLEALEEALARWLGTESSLLFTSGYAANVGTLSALIDPTDVVFSDVLNHASLIDGIRLSRARVERYPHLDLDALEKALRHAPAAGRRWVVTESVYSMDGDVASLAAMIALCDRYDAMLYVDEAHALGVLGLEGRGALGEVRSERIVSCGTFGKALGSGGAFVTGSRALRSHLWNRARSFVFSTGMAPALAGAVLKALELVSRETRRRARLRNHTHLLRSLLRAQGIDPGGHFDVPIVPVVLGSEERTMHVARELRARGYFVQGIRPPTVPPGTARLRITLSSEHDEDQIRGFTSSLVELLAEPRHSHEGKRTLRVTSTNGNESSP